MKQFFTTLFSAKRVPFATAKAVTVVSGLPRSGTSMMMKMLEAGGMQLLTDHQRAADSDNPEGYYEFERVKQLPHGDFAWLVEAEGKVVKIISALLSHLPAAHTYQVIFMHRHIEEILASQKKMLGNRGETTDQVSDAELAALFQKHKRGVQAWLQKQPNVTVLDVDYNRMLAEPYHHLPQIGRFLQGSVDIERMVAVIDPALYRNRTAAKQVL